MKSKIKMVVLTDSFLGRKDREATASTPRQMQQLVKSGIAKVKEESVEDEESTETVTESKQEKPKAAPKKQGKK